MAEIPVTLPPGLARLATSPFPTGSEAYVKTTGMVCVACLAANAGVAPVAAIRSTPFSTSASAAST